MEPNESGYFHRLWSALLGRAQPATVPASVPLPPTAPADLELRARVAALEMDLRQREELIAQMKSEYAALAAAKERAVAAAGQEHLEKLLRKLCGPLSNLAILAAATQAGKEVAAKDMADLVGDLEQQLVAVGLEPIGKVGEATGFDLRLHQRMSGGAVHAGTSVVVRMPGYRVGEKILQKAMVTAKEG